MVSYLFIWIFGSIEALIFFALLFDLGVGHGCYCSIKLLEEVLVGGDSFAQGSGAYKATVVLRCEAYLVDARCEARLEWLPSSRS
jgi:hypothetical protein